MMEKFWVLIEHMLNSVIFVLGTSTRCISPRYGPPLVVVFLTGSRLSFDAGGMVWGRIISNEDPDHEITMHFYFEDCEWGRSSLRSTRATEAATRVSPVLSIASIYYSCVPSSCLGSSHCYPLLLDHGILPHYCEHWPQHQLQGSVSADCAVPETLAFCF